MDHFTTIFAKPSSTVFRGAPFGLAPAFWTPTADRTFASASDAASASSSINADRLAALISLAPPLREDESLYHDVHRVPSGSRVVIDASGRSNVFYDEHPLSELHVSPLDAAHELWRLVTDSVGRAIAGAKRVAVLTGGGVDSAAVLGAAVAANRGGNETELLAIALDFAGEGDDRPHLRELTHALGIEAIRVAPLSGAKNIRRLLEHPRGPIWSPGCAGDLSLLERAKELDVDVVLTGAGGDDVFDGYPQLLGTDVWHGDVGAALLAARLQVPWRSSALTRVSDFIVRPLLGSVLSQAARRARRRRIHRRTFSWAGPTLASFIDADSERWRMPRFDTPTARFDFLARAPSLTDVIEMCNEVEKLAGVKVAYPYLDEELVAFVSSLPPRALLHAGRLRGLFRLAARGTIPKRVRLRKDKARFENARREMLAASGGVEQLTDLATMTKCAELGLVDPERFRAVFQAFPRDLKDDDSSWTRIWPALSVEGFLRARASAARA